MKSATFKSLRGTLYIFKLPLLSKRSYVQKLYLLLFVLLSQSLNAQIGNLDPTFGENGIEKISYISRGSLVSDKGESYAIDVTNDAYTGTTQVHKYTSSGLPDLSYGTNGATVLLQMRYFASGIQDDGKIVVVGTIGPPLVAHDQTMIVRFNEDGTLDATFTLGFGLTYAFPTKLIKQGNELVLFGYYVSLATGRNVDFINWDNSGAELGPSRENLGFDQSNFSQSKYVAIQGSKIIVAGLERLENHIEGYYLTKYSNSNNPDPTFGINGRVAETLPADDYRNMLLTESGKILIIGKVLNQTTGDYDFRLIRLNQNGSPDLTFNGTGTQTTDFGSDDIAYAATLQDDKIIVAGSTTNKITGDKEFAIARYNDDGTLDNTFSEDGKQTLGEAGSSYSLEKIKVEGDRLLASGGIISNDGKTFRVTAAYLLKENITLTCPPARITSTDKGICAAVVNDIAPTITPTGSNPLVKYTFDGATQGNGTGSLSGQTFNKGETNVTYELVDDPSKTCSFLVTVEDKEAPLIANAFTNITSIWPPNHKMVNVEVNYDLLDNCEIINPVLTITSNEPESGTDEDDVAGDWKIIDAHHVQLRAERSNRGNGRVYTITIAATDAAGNKIERQLYVTVQHDKSMVKGKKGEKGLSVKILSNPSVNFFRLVLESSSDELASLRVFNNFGRIVEIRSGISANAILQIGSGYRAGIYFAEIYQGNEKRTVTMIKL